MQFSKQGSSSFTPYQGPRSVTYSNQEMQLLDLSRLSLNSPRSNASMYAPNIQSIDHHSDRYTLRTRKRKGSVSLEWKESSIPGNNTFLGKSLIGKSSLFQDNDDFHFNDIGYVHGLQVQELSERSCPVPYDESHFGKIQRYNLQEGLTKEKNKKRFQKTKNLLRTISTYFHKYLKYNKKAKKVVFMYLKKTDHEITDPECQDYFKDFLEWVSTLNMINFTQYQKIWITQSKYRTIYRQMCYKYYTQQAYCDIHNSRLTTKYITYQYLHQFIQGLMNPSQFTQFKNQ